MAGFLKEYPMYTEFQYKWNLSIEKRIIMLADAPRVEYSNKKANGKDGKEKKDEVIIQEGTLGEFFGGIAKKVKK